jgi:hypothetical protein
MSDLTQQQLLTLKRQLHDAHAHIVDAARAYREAGDGTGATRAEALACQLSAEIEYLDLLLAKTQPLPTPVHIA